MGHGGGDAGYRADMIRFPEQHFSVATLCNLASINPGMLARRVADIYLASDFRLAKIPASDVATLPQPSPDQLAPMVGVYVDSNDGDQVLRLLLEDGKLWGGPLKGKGSELKALNDNRFRYIAFPTELDFKRAETGTPIGLTAYVRGMKPHQFRRVSSFDLTNAQLQEFTGVFRSDEIEMPYEAIIKDSNLVLRSLKTTDLLLFPVTPDLFVGGDNRIRFTRDAQGQVSGALLNTSRTRNFRFERVTQ